MSVRIVEGNLLDQDVDAIANAWNRNYIPWFLLRQHGVAGAIRARAGTQPFRELGFRPLAIGEARVTSAGRLPFRAIIHVPGIDWNWTSNADIAGRAATAVVAAAVQRMCASVAMPVFGSGVGGLDVEEALVSMRVALDRFGVPEPMDVRIVRLPREPGEGPG